jgi:hypothetical protein
MVEVAGMTAFTDEFGHPGKEWKPFNAPVPPIEKLIGRYGHEVNIDYAGLRRVRPSHCA